jgi:phosphoenolpyruvate-protein kinase (PTS system EI component)
MTDNGLTQKQEAFALAYVETGNAAEAYRRAYDVKAATQHSTIYSAASRLLADSKISARVVELQDQAATMSLFTVKQAFDEYEQARQLAMKAGVDNPSAAVAAVKGKVALFGLEAPSKAKHEHSSPDGSMSPRPPIDLTKAPPEFLEWLVAQNDEADKQ